MQKLTKIHISVDILLIINNAARTFFSCLRIMIVVFENIISTIRPLLNIQEFHRNESK